MSCSTLSEATLEQRTGAARRKYLAALMRIEALDEADDALVSEQDRVEAEAAHFRSFAILNLFLNELSYVPTGPATRSDLAMASTCEAAPSEGVRQPDQAARAVERAKVRIRSA